MYCSTMWYNCTVTAMRRLRIAYNQLNFGWGVEHLSTPPDFEKIFIRGGWLPLN